MTAALGIRSGNFQGFILTGSSTNHIVDASNEGVAWGFQSETADPITHVWFRYGARTGTPPTYRISLQGILSGGNPDGTVLGGGSPASATFTPPADTTWDGLGQWIALDNAYTPTLGQMLILVIEYSSGTIDGSNNSSFSRVNPWNTKTSLVPYTLSRTSGTWAKNSGGVSFGYRTASSRYGVMGSAFSTLSTSTTGQRYAVKTLLPSGFGSTYKVAGMTLAGVFGTTAGSVKFCIWDEAGTELAETGTLDADHQGDLGNVGNWNAVFTTQPTLNYGTAYYFGAESVSSNPVGIRGITLTEDDDRLAFPLQKNITLSLWDGASWSDVTSVYPYIDLSLSEIVSGSGSPSSTTIICRR